MWEDEEMKEERKQDYLLLEQRRRQITSSPKCAGQTANGLQRTFTGQLLQSIEQ